MASRELQAKAHRAVRQEIVMGRMVRPEVCSMCGRDPGKARDGRTLIQGHHHRGYNHPLDVVWICVHCHRAETPVANGARNAFAKLTESDVVAICQSEDGVAALAQQYGVSTTTIINVRNGRRWSHVEGRGQTVWTRPRLDPNATGRECRDCGEFKPLCAFTPAKDRALGVEAMCRVCRAARKRAKYRSSAILTGEKGA